MRVALLGITGLAVVAAVTFAYQLAEFRAKVWAPPERWLKIGLTLVAIAAVGLTIWMCNRY